MKLIILSKRRVQISIIVIIIIICVLTRQPNG
jgi:hypothetical protein